MGGASSSVARRSAVSLMATVPLVEAMTTRRTPAAANRSARRGGAARRSWAARRPEPRGAHPEAGPARPAREPGSSAGRTPGAACRIQAATAAQPGPRRERRQAWAAAPSPASHFAPTRPRGHRPGRASRRAQDDPSARPATRPRSRAAVHAAAACLPVAAATTSSATLAAIRRPLRSAPRRSRWSRGDAPAIAASSC